MSKFISVKVFRGTISEDKKHGQFAGQPGGLEIPFWPVVMFLAFFDATAEQIRRAIKERKNEK